MKYYVEENLENFKAWSGAVRTLEILGELGKIEEIEGYLEELGELSDTDINDFLWFESDFIFGELLGLTEEEVEELYR